MVLTVAWGRWSSVEGENAIWHENWEPGHIFWLRTYIYIYYILITIKTWDWISTPKNFQSRRLQHVTRKRKLRYRIHILSWNSGWCHTILIQNSNVPSMALVTFVLLPSGKKRCPVARCPPPSACEYVAGCGGHPAAGFGGARVRNQIFLLSQAKPCVFLFSLENLKQNYCTSLNSGSQ